jgi:HlyD family secretion protein
MNVKLAFLAGKISHALVVPLAAIVTKKDGQTGVLVLDKNNKAQFQPVTIGPTSGNQIQIVKGVSLGEQILLSPPEGQAIPGVESVGL